MITSFRSLTAIWKSLWGTPRSANPSPTASAIRRVACHIVS